jgi:hypothetical protein
LKRLHDDGCERDQAGNRDLHFDQYCMLILLYLFCPAVTSLRGILQASGLEIHTNSLALSSRVTSRFTLKDVFAMA